MRNRTIATLVYAGALLLACGAGGCTMPSTEPEPTGHPSNDQLAQPDMPDTAKFDNGSFIQGGM